MVPNFQGLGDFLNNAYKGYQMASLPEQQKADKQAQDLKNQLVTAQTQSAVLKNKYTPQKMQDEQQLNAARLKNFDAQTNLANAQTSAVGQPTGQMAQLFALQSRYPQGSAQWNQINDVITKLGQGQAPTTISYDENGRPIVSVGGSGGGRRGAGGLGLDANGNVISMPTTATQTNLQGRITGEQIATPFVNDLVKKLPQFQTLTGKAKLGGERFANLLGANFKGPSDAAAGAMDVTNAAEGLIKAAGLYGAHANLDTMMKVLQPVSGESADRYKDRIANYMDIVLGNTGKAQSSLTGFQVSGQSSKQNNDPLGIL